MRRRGIRPTAPYSNLQTMNADTILYVYGAIVLLGGMIGYATAKSTPSLIAGVGSGVVLLACGYLLSSGNDLGLYLGLAMAVALTVFFTMRFIRTRKVMPALVMSLASIAAAVLLAVRL